MMKSEFETKVAIARIDAAEFRCHELEAMHSNEFADGNEKDYVTGSVTWAETPGMLVSHAMSRDARLALEAVLDDIRITADLPERIVVQILNRRLQVVEIEDWCEQLVRMGGEPIKHQWLRTQIREGLINKDHPLDPRVLKAAVLMDSERKVSRVKHTFMAA